MTVDDTLLLFNDNSRNLSINQEEDSPTLYEIPLNLQLTFKLAYFLVSFISVMGNFLIIFVVIKNKAMHNVTNYFIGNLALVDIIISVFSTPFQFQAAMLQRWIWSPVLCKLGPFSTSLNINVSVLTLAAISLDRFYVIFYPLKPKLRLKHFYMIICSIWIVSVLLSSFNLINYRIVSYNETNILFNKCEIVYPLLTRVYLIIQTLIQFIVPFFSITFSVVAIYYKIFINEKHASPLNFSFHSSRIRNRRKVSISKFKN
jgi:hypothetical protein